MGPRLAPAGRGYRVKGFKPLLNALEGGLFSSGKGFFDGVVLRAPVLTPVVGIAAGPQKPAGRLKKMEVI